MECRGFVDWSLRTGHRALKYVYVAQVRNRVARGEGGAFQTWLYTVAGMLFNTNFLCWVFFFLFLFFSGSSVWSFCVVPVPAWVFWWLYIVWELDTAPYLMLLLWQLIMLLWEMEKEAAAAMGCLMKSCRLHAAHLRLLSKVTNLLCRAIVWKEHEIKPHLQLVWAGFFSGTTWIYLVAM